MYSEQWWQLCGKKTRCPKGVTVRRACYDGRLLHIGTHPLCDTLNDWHSRVSVRRARYDGRLLYIGYF